MLNAVLLAIMDFCLRLRWLRLPVAYLRLTSLCTQPKNNLSTGFEFAKADIPEWHSNTFIPAHKPTIRPRLQPVASDREMELHPSMSAQLEKIPLRNTTLN